MPRLISVVANLRERNQVTVPKAIVEAMGLEPGDRLIFYVDAGNPISIKVHELLRSYAGILAGVYGSPEEAAEYLRQEREAWGE